MKRKILSIIGLIILLAMILATITFTACYEAPKKKMKIRKTKLLSLKRLVVDMKS